MRIEFEVTIDDLVAFNRHTFEANRSRACQIACVALPVLTAIALGWVLAPGGNRLLGAVTLAIVGTMTAVGFRNWYPDVVERTVRKTHADDQSGTLGRHVLEVSAGMLHDTTDVGSSSRTLSSVLRVDKTPDHVFVYLSPVLAFAVRRSAVLEGELAHFVDAVEAGMGS